MVGLSILLVVVALVIAFFLFFKLLRNAIKALMFVLFLVLFVVGVLGFLVYLDVGKVKGSFENGQTALLLHDGSIVAGFTYSENPNEVLQSDKFQLLNKETLAGIDDSFKKGSYTGEDTLTIIIESDYFIGTSVELADGYTLKLDNKTIYGVFSCEDLNKCISPLIDVAPSLEKQIAASFDDEQDLKNKLFFSVFSQETKESKGSFIISGIKEDKIIVYPSLTTLKLVKMIPDSLITKAISKVSGEELSEEKNTPSTDD